LAAAAYPSVRRTTSTQPTKRSPPSAITASCQNSRRTLAAKPHGRNPPYQWVRDGAYAGPDLWREYLREDIPPLFGARFSPGNWNAGIVRLDNTLILLTTLKKGGLTAGSHYEDHFLGPDRMPWQSQTQTRRDSQIGRMLSGADDHAPVHLFVRNGKLRNGKAAPFLYCSRPEFERWESEGPITVTWRLPLPVPQHLRAGLGIAG
jgi:hypothetical protein